MNLHFIVPEGVDDPAGPSGGNVYDRQVIRSLAAVGHRIQEHTTTDALEYVPANATVLVDGLIASAIPELLARQAKRLNLVILVHMLFGDDDPSLRPAEAQAFRTATAIVTTSEWSRARLLELYRPLAARVFVAAPGVEPASPTVPNPDGSRLLCVAAVAPHKGHDILIDALTLLEELAWTCTCAGSLSRDPAFAARIALRTKESGLENRIAFPGPRVGADLAATYASADLLVVPSRGETYGMVVTEALARGIPVVASAAKGLPEALGRAPDGRLPGILVPPEDPAALAIALRRWLHDPQSRARLHRSALDRRATLTGWDTTAKRLAETFAVLLEEVPLD
ncbi:MAG TPA: glycosyltransferase family 4 protein [Candidatus Limnocylindrales bacterium]|nr:glycosyltransferase family 4 protein [Candidatus Limnocylindrales bacterium]